MPSWDHGVYVPHSPSDYDAWFADGYIAGRLDAAQAVADYADHIDKSLIDAAVASDLALGERNLDGSARAFNPHDPYDSRQPGGAWLPRTGETSGSGVPE